MKRLEGASSSHAAGVGEVLGGSRRISEVGIQVIGLACLLVVLLFVTWLVNKSFHEPDGLDRVIYKLQTLSRDVAILALFALGQGIIIIAGGIDLSSGSVICFVGVTALHLMVPEYGTGWPIYAVLPLGLAFGALIGAVHGVLVCHVRLQPFMVTLCSLLVFRSVARGLTSDQSRAFHQRELPGFFVLGNSMPLGVPLPVWILAGVLLVLLVFMHATVHGRYLYAIGYNLEAARFSGVRIHSLRIFTFTLGGFLAGLAGLVEASKLQNVAPSSAGIAYELHGITAAVLGGCALRGGQGSLIGVVVGASVLKVLRDMIVFLGLGTHWADAVIGVVLLCAVVADALVKRRRGY